MVRSLNTIMTEKLGSREAWHPLESCLPCELQTGNSQQRLRLLHLKAGWPLVTVSSIKPHLLSLPWQPVLKCLRLGTHFSFRAPQKTRALYFSNILYWWECNTFTWHELSWLITTLAVLIHDVQEEHGSTVIEQHCICHVTQTCASGELQTWR